MHYFLKYAVCPQKLIRQNTYIVMMSKERSTKIIKFVTPGEGVLVLGRNGLISHLLKMHFSNIILCFRAWVRQTKYSIAN